MATTMTNTPVSYEQASAGSDDGYQIGLAGSKVGFYGKVPVIQRPYSSAVHATSGYVSSGSFGATQLAIVVEIANTLVGLGVWATV
jgi:hypothetical protein